MNQWVPWRTNLVLNINSILVKNLVLQANCMGLPFLSSMTQSKRTYLTFLSLTFLIYQIWVRIKLTSVAVWGFLWVGSCQLLRNALHICSYYSTVWFFRYPQWLHLPLHLILRLTGVSSLTCVSFNFSTHSFLIYRSHFWNFLILGRSHHH